MKLFLSAVTKVIAGILLVGALVFLPAGTFDFFGGWLFITVLFVPILLLGTVLLIKSPTLLKKRLDSKEKDPTQKGVVAFSGLMFTCGFIVAGLDFRFGWLKLPRAVEVAAAAVFLLSYVLYALVLRENAYLSRTVKVERSQTVVDTGLYALVRHPMYMATVLMFMSMPLILGSIFAFLIFCAYPFIIAIRIKNEEQLLTRELAGYAEYKKKVRFRLIPFIW